MFNLKDEKNLGLFRKVVTRRIGPRALVAMTAEQLASKELKEWRQAEQRGEIDKIRAHELDLAKQGNKVVIKTHKGDQIVDVDDQGGVCHILAHLFVACFKWSTSIQDIINPKIKSVVFLHSHY